MNITLVEFLQVVVLVSTVVAAIYRIAGMERAIYKAIDDLDKKLDIHLQDAVSKYEMINYRLNVLSEKIDYKVDRLNSNQEDIQAYLHKQSGFNPRNDDLDIPD